MRSRKSLEQDLTRLQLMACAARKRFQELSPDASKPERLRAAVTLAETLKGLKDLHEETALRLSMVRRCARSHRAYTQAADLGPQPRGDRT